MESDREVEIRSHLQEFKSRDWVGDLLILLNEMGETRTEEQDQSLPGFGKAITSKVFEWGLMEAKKEIQIELCAQELFVRKDQKSLLEMSFLPKNNEYILLYWDQSRAQELEEIREQLLANIKRAKQMKSERQKAFQDRFHKN